MPSWTCNCRTGRCGSSAREWSPTTSWRPRTRWLPPNLGLGSVFVGAVRNRPDEIAAGLGLPPHTVAAFGLAVGEPDPAENAAVKPRLPQAAVLHHERYDAASADAHIPRLRCPAGRIQPEPRPGRRMGRPGAQTPRRPAVDGWPGQAPLDTRAPGTHVDLTLRAAFAFAFSDNSRSQGVGNGDHLVIEVGTPSELALLPLKNRFTDRSSSKKTPSSRIAPSRGPPSATR
jgi:hypothetical protein